MIPLVTRGQRDQRSLVLRTYFSTSRAVVHNGQLYLFQLGSTESPTFLYTNTGWVGAEEMRNGRIHRKGVCESILLG